MDSTIGPELNKRLAEKLNDEMTSAVLPVTIFVGVEAVFGLFGNTLILYVFLSRYHACNFKYFVLCLAFIDTTSILTCLPGEIVTQIFWYVYPYPIVCKIKSFFNMFTVCGSAFCLLLIAVDRFRKICRPLKWQIKPNIALILCLTSMTISFIIALPVPFFWGIHSYEEVYEMHRINVTVCELDQQFVHTVYPKGYTIAVEVILCIVMTSLLILYMFVCRSLFWIKLETEDVYISDGDGQSSRLNSGTGVTSEVERTEEKILGKLRISLPPADNHLKPTGKPLMTPESNNKETAPLDIKTDCGGSRMQSARDRIKKKTAIMLILTAVFIVTTILYLTLLNLIANGILGSLSSTEKAFYFFFFRLYFINHVINPVLYGFLDPHFRRVLKHVGKSVTTSYLCSSTRKLSVSSC